MTRGRVLKSAFQSVSDSKNTVPLAIWISHILVNTTPRAKFSVFSARFKPFKTKVERVSRAGGVVWRWGRQCPTPAGFFFDVLRKRVNKKTQLSANIDFNLKNFMARKCATVAPNVVEVSRATFVSKHNCRRVTRVVLAKSRTFHTFSNVFYNLHYKTPGLIVEIAFCISLI